MTSVLEGRDPGAHAISHPACRIRLRGRRRVQALLGAGGRRQVTAAIAVNDEATHLIFDAWETTW